jgi:hypothetical protein
MHASAPHNENLAVSALLSDGIVLDAPFCSWIESEVVATISVMQIQIVLMKVPFYYLEYL